MDPRPTDVVRPTNRASTEILDLADCTLIDPKRAEGKSFEPEAPILHCTTVVDAGGPDPRRDKSVLIIGINYAPEPTGIAPYTTGLARHLAERASVEVFTGLPHYPSWRVEPLHQQGRVSRQALATPGTPSVTRLKHHVPRRQSALTRARYEGTFLLNCLASRPTQRPDLVMAVTPSLGGAVAGAHLAKRYDVPLVVVVQDLMAKAANQSGIIGGGTVARLTAMLEGYALRQASQVAIVTEAFRETVSAYGVDSARVHLMPNWSHIDQGPQDGCAARAALGWSPTSFIVAHTGNMGLKQDLVNVVEAARLLNNDVEVILIGDGSQRHAVTSAAKGVTNVRFVEPLDDARYPLALAAADVLLVNERPSVGDMSLPSKLTSYFSAGRPVLAAVATDGATAAELRRTGGAARHVPAGDPAALAEALRALRADPAARATMGRAGLAYATRRLSREASMSRLDAVLAAALADSAR